MSDKDRLLDHQFTQDHYLSDSEVIVHKSKIYEEGNDDGSQQEANGVSLQYIRLFLNIQIHISIYKTDNFFLLKLSLVYVVTGI